MEMRASAAIAEAADRILCLLATEVRVTWLKRSRSVVLAPVGQPMLKLLQRFLQLQLLVAAPPASPTATSAALAISEVGVAAASIARGNLFAYTPCAQ
jgi:hypothetical protein